MRASQHEPPGTVILRKLETGQAALRHQSRLRNLQSLVAVQRARFAVWPFSSKVVKPVCDVGILLDFKENKPWPECVHGSRRDEHSLIGFRVEALKQIRARSAVYRCPKLSGSDAGFEAEQKLGVPLRLEDVPHFALAHAARLVLAGILVV